MVFGLLRMMIFKGSLKFESWIEIQGRGGSDMMVLKVVGEDLESKIDNNQKGFVLMIHGCFVVIRSVDKLLVEDFQLLVNIDAFSTLWGELERT